MSGGRSPGPAAPAPTAVVKIGGSVLRGGAGWASAVRCVARERAAGARVLVVVSATRGTTDRLLARARRLAPRPPEAFLARLLLTGEESSAALLAIALAEAGTPAGVESAEGLGLRVDGSRGAARPIGVDVARLEGRLALDGVLVVPGFVGCHVDGGVALLGRGGSDLTAVFLAARLGASCRLIKDVDGLYTSDPNATGSPPSRYARASWSVAMRCGGDLVQRRAIRLAEAAGVCVRVEGVDGRGTTVDAGPCVIERDPSPVARRDVGCRGVG